MIFMIAANRAIKDDTKDEMELNREHELLAANLPSAMQPVAGSETSGSMKYNAMFFKELLLQPRLRFAFSDVKRDARDCRRFFEPAELQRKLMHLTGGVNGAEGRYNFVVNAFLQVHNIGRDYTR
jgi:hypothetical protein